MSIDNYVKNAIKDIDNLNACDILQARAKDIREMIKALEKQAQDKAEELLQYTGLATPPVSSPLGDAGSIAWIVAFIKVNIEPKVEMAAKYTQKVQDYAKMGTDLTRALERAAQRIGDCPLNLENGNLSDNAASSGE